MTPLQMAIIKTIAYADIFDYPLTASEIHRFLIIDTFPSRHNKLKQLKTESKPITQTSVNSTLSVLLKKSQLDNQGNFYFLPVRQSIVSLRQKREQVSRSKITRAKKITQKLALLPAIQGIFLTGALAMHNADKSDDIDLLIITQPHTLWSTRLIVNLIADTLNLRRRPNPFHLQSGISSSTSEVEEKNYSDKLCLNMWLDQTALALPRSKQNLYTAHEVAQVIPLVNKNHTYEQFLITNSWIKKYLPNIYRHHTQSHSGPACPPIWRDPESIQTILDPRFREDDKRSGLIELIAFKLQYHYMRQKITRETITPHAAFFHPRNTARQILHKYTILQSKLLQVNN